MRLWILGGANSSRLLCKVTLLLGVSTLGLQAFAADPPALSPVPVALSDSSSSVTDLVDLSQTSAVSPLSEPGPAYGVAGHDGDRVSNVPSIQSQREPLPDPSTGIYYKNKLDVSIEGGFLPINVPFMFDFLVGDAYITEKVHYTMVPVFASLDWQMSHMDGPWFLRGTWDATFGGTAAAIPRGPESKFFGYHMGIRRNFVQPRWKVVPYLDGRVGVGHIDARGPEGVWGAQGQDLVFSLNISSGLRYQVSKHYSMSVAAGYMHISNMYLSLPRYANNGINVTGMMFGVHYRIPTREERTSTR